LKQSRNYLRDAKIHELIGGIFAWIWLLGTLAGVVWIIGAIFGSFSWWKAIGLIVGAQFAKVVHRDYRSAAQKAIQDGIAAGQIHIDATNTARATEPREGAA